MSTDLDVPVDDDTGDEPYVRERGETRLVNQRDVDEDEFDVGIGRARNGKATMATVDEPGQPGWLGNPYVTDEHGGDYTREESVRQFREDFRERLRADERFREAVDDLEGKTLACWCVPDLCHGDVVLEYLDKGELALVEWENQSLHERVGELEETVESLATKTPTKAMLNRMMAALTGSESIDLAADPTQNLAELDDLGDRIGEMSGAVERHESTLDEFGDGGTNTKEEAWQSILDSARNLQDHRDHAMRSDGNEVKLFKKEIASATGKSERQAQNYIEQFGDSKNGARWQPYKPPSNSRNGKARKKALIVDLDVWGAES